MKKIVSIITVFALLIGSATLIWSADGMKSEVKAASKSTITMKSAKYKKSKQLTTVTYKLSADVPTKYQVCISIANPATGYCKNHCPRTKGTHTITIKGKLNTKTKAWADGSIYKKTKKKKRMSRDSVKVKYVK